MLILIDKIFYITFISNTQHQNIIKVRADDLGKLDHIVTKWIQFTHHKCRLTPLSKSEP